MNSLREYFHTDWGAMTASDWIGTIITVVVFLLMVGLYVYVLRPKNREKLEIHRHIPVSSENKRIEIGGKR
uniref:Cytochrome c oxidase cbb3-type subunit 4 n=1 Tax=Candidatus Kentrum sp. SD TaxID=2126332 RepID=A0A450YV62_9GAMM|nr:MAG: cytochrome c oxidase cbb3-type subunit 4 [Candidatus Kentron sp. SD]VFK45437.1 MAG: cytochrome c oxidase cbb3-type subunit 4 [Candidatus Kentron sp. SD]VFK79803.1 MAG: cytochrome c oxidase cbb3-type subunit 4 [Candidatus Kentron sp. SD]